MPIAYRLRQSGRTTQYLRHPSTLKAVIWCVPPDGQNLLPQEISVQLDPQFQRYGEISQVIFKSEVPHFKKEGKMERK